jgi:hypothetical protein
VQTAWRAMDPNIMIHPSIFMSLIYTSLEGKPMAWGDPMLLVILYGRELVSPCECTYACLIP